MASARAWGKCCRRRSSIRDGRVLNANLTDYKMPTSLDVPPIRIDPDRVPE